MVRSQPVVSLAALGASLALVACLSPTAAGTRPKQQASPPNALQGEANSAAAGDIPDNQVYVRFAVPGAGYSVRVPEGWSRISRGGAVVFTDKLNAIRLETGAPAHHAGKVAVVHRQAGTARKLTYLATAPPDPVTGKTVTDAVERYVFTHGGRTAVLTLSGPRGADNVDPWRIVTDSLRWTG